MRISDWSSDVCSSDLRNASAGDVQGGSDDGLLQRDGGIAQLARVDIRARADELLTNQEILWRIDRFDALDPIALQMENRKACGTQGASQKDIFDIGCLAGDLPFHVILFGTQIGRTAGQEQGVSLV